MMYLSTPCVIYTCAVGLCHAHEFKNIISSKCYQHVHVLYLSNVQKKAKEGIANFKWAK
jgi:hypothetical protein